MFCYHAAQNDASFGWGSGDVHGEDYAKLQARAGVDGWTVEQRDIGNGGLGWSASSALSSNRPADAVSVLVQLGLAKNVGARRQSDGNVERYFAERGAAQDELRGLTAWPRLAIGCSTTSSTWRAGANPTRIRRRATTSW